MPRVAAARRRLNGKNIRVRREISSITGKIAAVATVVVVKTTTTEKTKRKSSF
jgi:hypothetical protein